MTPTSINVLLISVVSFVIVISIATSHRQNFQGRHRHLPYLLVDLDEHLLVIGMTRRIGPFLIFALPDSFWSS